MHRDRRLLCAAEMSGIRRCEATAERKRFLNDSMRYAFRNKEDLLERKDYENTSTRK